MTVQDGSANQRRRRPSLTDTRPPVEPPNCACKGSMRQAREHTASWCSVLTTKELNDLLDSLS